MSPLWRILFLLLMFGAFCITYISMDITNESATGEENRMNGAKTAFCAALNVVASVMVNYAAAATG